MSQHGRIVRLGVNIIIVNLISSKRRWDIWSERNLMIDNVDFNLPWRWAILDNDVAFVLLSLEATVFAPFPLMMKSSSIWLLNCYVDVIGGSWRRKCSFNRLCAFGSPVFLIFNLAENRCVKLNRRSLSHIFDEFDLTVTHNIHIKWNLTVWSLTNQIILFRWNLVKNGGLQIDLSNLVALHGHWFNTLILRLNLFHNSHYLISKQLSRVHLKLRIDLAKIKYLIFQIS